MGVFSFEQNRQYAVRTEVLALITLVEYGNLEQKHNALKQLMVIAYPLATAKKINQETLNLECQDCADLYGIDAGMTNCKCEKCESD
tara:strand:+ start:51 stop:311 length:261 start_codon:yes stop_codon:yes gene_type:complete